MRPRLVVGLVCVFVLFAFTLIGCVPPPDPVTLQHLRIIAASDTVSADSCGAFIAYEQSKKDAKDPKFDRKSLSHVQKVCECFQKANPAVKLEMDACKMEDSTAIIYEKGKIK